MQHQTICRQGENEFPVRGALKPTHCSGQISAGSIVALLYNTREGTISIRDTELEDNQLCQNAARINSVGLLAPLCGWSSSFARLLRLERRRWRLLLRRLDEALRLRGRVRLVHLAKERHGRLEVRETRGAVAGRDFHLAQRAQHKGALALRVRQVALNHGKREPQQLQRGAETALRKHEVAQRAQADGLAARVGQVAARGQRLW